jgi:hypothetical protein
MPYIVTEARRRLADTGTPLTAGELNYLFTTLCVLYVNDHGLKYETLNTIVGALESAKAEFQRRVVAPYEDGKIKTNGDVYP